MSSIRIDCTVLPLQLLVLYMVYYSNNVNPTNKDYSSSYFSKRN